jgi:hypothetical protein
MNYIVHVSSIVWRIENQPSNSTSCSGNAPRLLVLVVGRLYWELQVTTSFSIWGCVMKGIFGIGIFWRAKSHLKGIEDFNLWWYHNVVVILSRECRCNSLQSIYRLTSGFIIGALAFRMNTLGCTQKLAVDQCSGLDFAMEPVCMFDKIHLPLNFKSKVARDNLKNKNECWLTSAFYYLDFWLHNILKKKWYFE